MGGQSNTAFLLVLGVVAAVAIGGGLLVGNLRSADPVRAEGTPAASPSPDDDHAESGGHTASNIVPPEVDLETTPIATDRQVRADFVLDGEVKVFTLTADEVRWEIIPDVWVTAWGYNGQVPGPEIWVNEGDAVRVEFTNRLQVPTTIHWHGINVPNEMDGVPGVSQDEVEPGGSFTYEFVASPFGTFWYHSHVDSARQLDMGLSGAFVIQSADEPQYDEDFVQLLDEWIRLPSGRNGWEGVGHAGHAQSEYNWYTINGKSFPATERLEIDEGDRVRIRFINAGYQAHPMHLHGKRFKVIAKDGALLESPYLADTITVAAGERYSIEVIADDPGDWMLHCHIPHHTGNDTVEPGGLMTFMEYRDHDNVYQREKGQR